MNTIDTVIVFSSGDTPHPSVLEGLSSAQLVIAADGGHDVAADLGVTVDVVVGDLDSIGTVHANMRVERHPEDKDATDLELALEHAFAQQPRRIVVVGGTGGRHDHELAVATLLTSPRWREVEEIDWLSARGRAHVVRRRRTISGREGSVVSLIPMHGTASGVVTLGLRWDLSGDSLQPGSTRGVSNLFEGGDAVVTVADGVLLAVIPR